MNHVVLTSNCKVGSVQQVVTVSDAPPLINTADGSGGTILSQREIEDSPLNGRQVYSLIGTTPGSQFTTTNVASTTGGMSPMLMWSGGACRAISSLT